MKFLKVGLLTFFVLLLTGCALTRVQIHDQLVKRLDAVNFAEVKVSDQYFALEEGDSISELVLAAQEFDIAVSALQKFFDSTFFYDKKQKVFVEKFNVSVNPFLTRYVNTTNKYVEALQMGNGIFKEELAEPYYPDMDDVTLNFADRFNDLVDYVNSIKNY